jgi:hypothetical protein
MKKKHEDRLAQNRQFHTSINEINSALEKILQEKGNK